MAPREIPLGDDGERPAPPRVNLIAGVLFALILGLGVYAVLAGGLSSGAPATVAGASAPLALPINTATPPAPPATPASVAAPAPALPGCPDAAPVPDGARVGWRGRAAGCPDVLYASIGGAGRWVRRPAGFPESLYAQLPELPVR